MSDLTADYRYELPDELIAQAPAAVRDASRLLVLHRSTARLEHRQFPDLLEYLRPRDVLVVNDSRVIPARLRGEKAVTGGLIEVLLAEELAPNDWWVMLRPGKRVRPGTRLQFHRAAAAAGSAAAGPDSRLEATVLDKDDAGLYRLRFDGDGDVKDLLEQFGEVPLPPYIARPAAPSAEDRVRYQTIFAAPPGSVAAPTAGLHFTPALVEQIRARGVRVCPVTLHVGLGTFAPVKATRVADHTMHAEAFELPAATAQAIQEARQDGGRVIAAGTTSVRVLESVAQQSPAQAPNPDPALAVRAGSGRTSIFIRPPFRFRVVDALLTNFHLPESTLLMLVSAFAQPGGRGGRELVLAAYREAVRQRYRFFSYGDAMLLL